MSVGLKENTIVRGKCVIRDPDEQTGQRVNIGRVPVDPNQGAGRDAKLSSCRIGRTVPLESRVHHILLDIHMIGVAGQKIASQIIGYPVHASCPPQVVNLYIRCVRSRGTRVFPSHLGAAMGVVDLSAVSLLIMCVATNSSVMHPTRLDTVPTALAEVSIRTPRSTVRSLVVSNWLRKPPRSIHDR